MLAEATATLLLIALGSIVMGLELLLGLGIHNGGLSLVAAFSAHGLAIALAAAATSWSLLRPFRGVVLQLAVLTAIGGPFGAVVWAVVTLGTRHARASTSWKWIDDALEEEDERAVRVWNALLDGRLRIEGASKTAPLRDVLAGANPAAKLKVLAALAHRYDPTLAPSLTMSLRDENAAVRVMGAAVLAKLQASYATQVATAEGAAQQAVEASSTMAAALEHVRYAESGLLSVDQRAERLRMAGRWAEHVLTLEPGHEQARLVEARVLIGLRSFREALAKLQPPFADARCGETARALSHRAASALGQLHGGHVVAAPEMEAAS